MLVVGALLLVLAFSVFSEDSEADDQTAIRDVIHAWLDATSEGDARAVYETWDPEFRERCSFEREEAFLEGTLAGLLSGRADDAELQIAEITELFVSTEAPADQQAHARLVLRWSDNGAESEGEMAFIKRDGDWYLIPPAQECHT